MTDSQIQTAARLWMIGKDTTDIATALFLFESDVARNIENIKAEARLIKARAA